MYGHRNPTSRAENARNIDTVPPYQVMWKAPSSSSGRGSTRRFWKILNGLNWEFNVSNVFISAGNVPDISPKCCKETYILSIFI